RGCSFADFISWYSPRDVVAAAAATATASAAPTDATGAAGAAVVYGSGGGGGGSDGIGVALSARMGSGAISGSSAPTITASDTAAAAAPAATPQVSNNPWRRLWDSTAACPVWKQKPLQDPHLEGERVLHELETLSPVHLYDTLLAIALGAAVQLLDTSDGGSLPPVASLLRQYVRISAPIVKRGCGLVAASGAAAASTSVSDSSSRATAGSGTPSQRPTGQLPSPLALAGWEDAELEYLLAEFHYLEQAVVLGESLVRRLPGNRNLASDLMAATLHGNPSLEEGRTVLRPAAWVEGPMARQALAALLAGRPPPPLHPPSPPLPATGSGRSPPPPLPSRRMAIAAPGKSHLHHQRTQQSQQSHQTQQHQLRQSHPPNHQRHQRHEEDKPQQPHQDGSQEGGAGEREPEIAADNGATGGRSG
ncbi:hypothetical protein Vafri_17323, partial [Volvox africanus]